MPSTVAHPLVLADRAWFDSLLCCYGEEERRLAAFSFIYHTIWQGLLAYEWLELDDHYYLLARDRGGTFLALPPLGPPPLERAIVRGFNLLEERNHSSAVSRIENVPEGLAAQCRSAGYRVTLKSRDYLYRRADLVGLRGDRYKGPRLSYNHCRKEAKPSFRPYRPDDREACLAVFCEWQAGIKPDGESDFSLLLAADAESAHGFVFSHSDELQVIGRVAEVGGRIAGYTFGYPQCARDGDNERIFCVLLEIADRRIKGLPQFMFRELCRELVEYDVINAMDDSELPGLRRAKAAYHPLRLVESYIVRPQHTER